MQLILSVMLSLQSVTGSLHDSYFYPSETTEENTVNMLGGESGRKSGSTKEMVQSEDRKHTSFWILITCELACLKRELEDSH